MPLTLIPVAPIGKRNGTALVCPAGKMVPFSDDVYPESPNGDRLRWLRLGADGGRSSGVYMTLRACAAKLGIRTAQLSDLEMGRATLSDGDWAAAFDAVTHPDPTKETT